MSAFSERPIPLSWASLQTWLNCKLRWKLNYIDHVRLREDQRPYIAGAAVHDVMEAWYTSDWQPGFVKANLERIFKDVVKDRKVRLTRNELRDMWRKASKAASITELLYLKLGFPERGVMVETRFELPYALGAARLRGAWDVLDPSRKMVFDLKTSGSKPGGDDRQLLTYAVAASERRPPIELNKGAFLYPLLSPKIVSIDLGEEAVGEHRRVMNSMVLDVPQHEDREEWEPTPGSHCYRCPYYRTRHCPATLREGVRGEDGKVRFE